MEMKCVHWLATLAVLAALLELHPASAQRIDEYCYTKDEELRQTRHFSTKTAYQIGHGVNQQKYYNVPNCEAVKFWLFSRHGTRLPSADTISKLAELVDFRDEIVANFNSRRDRMPGQLCDTDVNLLEDWKWDPNITARYGDFLTVQGWNDLKILALDYQKRFPALLEFIYTPNKFQFAYTDSQRTEASFKSFAIGLFGEEAFRHINVPPVANDSMLLKPYDICPTFQSNSKKIKDKDSEASKFQNGSIYQQMQSQVSTRLGFKYTLNPKQIDRIWDMCRYNQAWNLDVKRSAFCAAFTPEHVNILEYLDDLKYYYKASYGFPENANVMCSTIQDMVKNLESTTNPKVIAYFAHASGIQLLLTALGVSKDLATLRADNYEEMKNRVFRTSELSMFASNLAVVKYDCPNENERYKVQFFLNEKPINFEWCRIGLCDLKAVQHQYKKYLDADCTKFFCTSSAKKSITSFLLGALLSTILILLF